MRLAPLFHITARLAGVAMIAGMTAQVFNLAIKGTLNGSQLFIYILLTVCVVLLIKNK